MLATNFSIDLEEVKKILNSLPVKSDQIAVCSRTGLDYSDGTGSIRDYPGVKERDFSKINPAFQNTTISKLIDDIHEAGYAHGRIRILTIPPRKCYSYHMDCEQRIHFAIDTNPGAFLIIDDIAFKVPTDGKGYLANTTLPHTALNAGDSDRIHLVIDLLFPVTKMTNGTYNVLDDFLDQSQFDKWLVLTKPPTEPIRMDFFFTN